MNQRISVIGGDARQIEVASSLRNCGYRVLLTGFDTDKIFRKDMTVENDLQKSVDFADIIVLPLPVSFEDETINAPLYSHKIMLNDFMKMVRKNQLLLTGMISKKTKTLCDVYGIYDMDYFQREEMKMLNAVPTSEGAIEIAMKEMPITLHDSRSLVLGYGRIGKILTKMLTGLGSHVTVTARRCSDLAAIQSFGYTAEKTDHIGQIISQYDVIFNTIPSTVIDQEVLEQVREDSLIIDLASKPGGVDFEAAKDKNKKVVWALSLPGEVTC